MSQNLNTFQPSAADLTAIDAALKTLEDRLVGLIDLSIEQRSTLMKMGDKSEAFCRKTSRSAGCQSERAAGDFQLGGGAA